MADFDSTPVFIENTPGVERIAELAPRDRDSVIENTPYTAFVKTALAQVLAEKNIDTVVITGLMTNYCSVTTARHAHDLDYRVIFVSGANAGPDMPDLGFDQWRDHSVGCHVLAGGVADVVSTDEVLAQISPT